MGSLTIVARPRSAADRLERDDDGAVWVVRCTSPPIDGRANRAIVRLLAEWLDVPGASVRLLRGEGSRRKTFEIVGIPEPEIDRRLREVLASAR